jgi:nuclear transport factor 2 (NTF2) superfamily protein
MTEQLKPPFTQETARAKVQRAEDLWNTKDPAKIALAYTPESQWRNRNEFLKGRAGIEEFLKCKWKKEQSYKLKKELFTFSDNRIAVHFEYEWHDENGQWYRSHGNENWEFDDDGLMKKRDASINDQKIDEVDRRI